MILFLWACRVIDFVVGERERADLGYADFKENAWIGGALDVSDQTNRLTVSLFLIICVDILLTKDNVCLH